MPTVESPTSTLAVDLSLQGEKQTIAIRCGDREVVKPSPLWVTDPLFREGEDRTNGALIAVDREERTIDRDFTTVSGKRRQHTYHATEATFDCDLANGQRIEFVVRVSEDGVAFRLRIPETGVVLNFAEEVGVRFPRKTIAWLSEYIAGHETNIQQTPAFDADGEFCTPGLFEVDEDWVLLTEADVDASFMPAQLSSKPQDDRVYFQHPELPVRTTSSFETPWRVFVVGDLETVVESDLVPALVDGKRIEDTDWIQPGRAVWSWWSEWDSPTDPEIQREYVDYASERGWEYVLVDEGWEPEWMPDLVDYAAQRGVGVFLWTHWSGLHDPEEREQKLRRWSDWGVAGIKVDVMDSNEQSRMQFYDRLMESAAAHELMVNFHSSLLPTGMKVRWPNVLTYESVKGAEHYEWSTLTPSHNAVLPYMRNVVGPMDYTPVTFSTENRHTTVGHELALSVVFESGLQHFADSIDEYAARPNAEWFLERVPAVWDETLFLGGRPGFEATIARRNGEEWFVGSIAAGPGRSIEVPLEFLPGERMGTMIRDDPAGSSLVRSRVSGSPTTTFEIDILENGGFCLYFPSQN